MALLPNINVGSAPNDGTGSSLRDAFTIVNENFQLIEAFFPNSTVANLVANIESTGTSVFNIANVDVLNVNTISTYTTTNIAAGNITATTGTFDTITANTVTGFTVTGNITANIDSTGESSFNNVSINAATITGNLTSGNINSAGTSTITGNLTSGNINSAGTSILTTIEALNLTTTFLTVTEANANTVNSDQIYANNINGLQDVLVAGNLISGNVSSNIGQFTNIEFFGNMFSYDPESVTVVNDFKSNGRFFSNTVTITSDANLAVDYLHAQTIVANLTAGNITVTLPNASVFRSDGLTYTFLCYDEGGLDNRTLTVNVQPGAGNIWTSANTQTTLVNISAELGTNSKNLKTNETFWFTY